MKFWPPIKEVFFFSKDGCFYRELLLVQADNQWTWATNPTDASAMQATQLRLWENCKGELKSQEPGGTDVY